MEDLPKLPYLGMTPLPREDEEWLLAIPMPALLALCSHFSSGKRIVGAGDRYMLVQIAAKVVALHPELKAKYESQLSTGAFQVILTDAKQIKKAKTADLVETYNAATGKDTKKFATRAAAEDAVKAILPKTKGRVPSDTKYILADSAEPLKPLRAASQRDAVFNVIKAKKGGALRSDIEAAVGYDPRSPISYLVAFGYIAPVA